MNIFYLDADPISCAKAHCDRHCIKMILEYTQLLSTAHSILDNNDKQVDGLYKPTHKNHPSAIWVRESVHNYNYVLALALALTEEHKFRYARNTYHKSRDILLKLQQPPVNIPNIPQTKLKLAITNTKLHDNDPIIAYRNYYRTEKRHIAFWKNRETPKWFY